jgi:hypothetical protein
MDAGNGVHITGVLGITAEISLPDMHAAQVWMLDNQLGRRNLTEKQMSYLRGMRMELEKQDKLANLKQGNSKPQNEVSEKTAVKLADQYKVSRATIERDATYASDINAIAAATDTQGARIVVETEGKLGRKEVKRLATRGYRQSTLCVGAFVQWPICSAYRRLIAPRRSTMWFVARWRSW